MGPSAARSRRTGPSSSSASRTCSNCTGLSFTEAVPSAEARRRIIAGEPVGSGAGQSPGPYRSSGRALARWVSAGTGRHVEPAGRPHHDELRGRATRDRAVAENDHRYSATASRSTDGGSSATAGSLHAGPDRDPAARPRQGAARRTWCSTTRGVVGRQSRQRSRRSASTAGERAPRLMVQPATIRSACRCRAPSRPPASTPGGPPAWRGAVSSFGPPAIVDHRVVVLHPEISCRSRTRRGWTKGAHTLKGGGEVSDQSSRTSSSWAAPRSRSTASTTSSTIGPTRSPRTRIRRGSSRSSPT